MSLEFLQSNPFQQQTTSVTVEKKDSKSIAQELEKASEGYTRAKTLVDKVIEQVGEKAISQISDDLLHVLKSDNELSEVVSQITKITNEVKQLSKNLEELSSSSGSPITLEIRKFLNNYFNFENQLFYTAARLGIAFKLLDKFFDKQGNEDRVVRILQEGFSKLEQRLTQILGNGRGDPFSQLEKAIDVIKKVKEVSSKLSKELGFEEGDEKRRNIFDFSKYNDEELVEAAKRYLRALGYEVVPADPNKIREVLGRWVDLSKEVEVERMRMTYELTKDVINNVLPWIFKFTFGMFKPKTKKLKNRLKNIIEKR